ncbi:MAG: ribosomal-processing cysteine protease Prp [Megasphaera sp.]|jgi:uncharacterized protein YsxB (DUF464 family)|uniref:ribosomal-processing cysteine protease Prp n=1 Tax=Megasphaera sueciensis TaxID=349094 RepID=UPI003D042316|nr:ribosomal-processing cysteine protease Prp [Megasphaera sp.]MCI1823104.1 ribosomal-processing cysteine protease Prp [Megasphaera sp.]
MISITLQYDQLHENNGFSVSGHADYSESGSDIVCAAISAVTQTALLGLMEYQQESVDYKIADGFLNVHVDCVTDETRVILKTLVLGLEQIVRQYDSYVVLNR